MTESEHIRETYAHFGLAVYLAQVLEHGIVNSMVILRLHGRDRLTQNEIDAFMDQQFEQTMGRLIKELRKQTNIPSKLQD